MEPVDPIALVNTLVGKMTENLVDSMAIAARGFIDTNPLFRDLSEDEKQALAYAIVGDLIASPLPEPLDTPIDVVVQMKLRDLLPESSKYMQMVSRIIEFLPILELLPTYSSTVLSVVLERRGWNP